MKMNFLISIVSALILGYLCANFIFNEYGNSQTTFSETNNIYFLQYGVYTKADSNDIKVDKYIQVEEEGKYYVYVGMTTNLENAEKIQKMYKDNGIDLYIKEGYVSNSEFVNGLEQYDILLGSSKTEDEINSVLSTVLASYEEFVLNR